MSSFDVQGWRRRAGWARHRSTFLVKIKGDSNLQEKLKVVKLPSDLLVSLKNMAMNSQLINSASSVTKN